MSLQLLDCLQLHLAHSIMPPLRMNFNDFGGPLNFHLVPSSSQNFNLSNTLVYDEIPAKLMTLVNMVNIISTKHQHVGIGI